MVDPNDLAEIDNGNDFLHDAICTADRAQAVLESIDQIFGSGDIRDTRAQLRAEHLVYVLVEQMEALGTHIRDANERGCRLLRHLKEAGNA